MKKIILGLIILMNGQIAFSQQNIPKLDIDHIIIWTTKDAPDTSLFQKNGFTVRRRESLHKGFGTGGRYIFFYNVYLELLFINDTTEFHNKFDNIMSMSRSDWRQINASPFGLGLSLTPCDSSKIPFATKSLQGAWMKPNSSLFIDTFNYNYLHEPLVIVIPPYMSFPKFKTNDEIKSFRFPDEKLRSLFTESATHKNDIRILTHLKIICDTTKLSSAMNALKDITYCEIVEGKENLLELTFDNNHQKKTMDFRPKLPIIIKY